MITGLSHSAGRWRAHLDSLTVTSTGRRIGDAAAESAFFLALAILPMMLTTTAVLRAMRPLFGEDVGPRVEQGLARLLRVVLTSRGHTAADAADDLLTGASSGALTVGTVASVLLVTRAMRSVLNGLASVAGRPHSVRIGWWREWGTAVASAILAVALAVLIMAMVALGPLFGHSSEIDTRLGRAVQDLWATSRWPVGLALVFGFVLLVHAIGLRAGDRRRTRRAAFVGAAVTAIGASAATVLLPVYVHIAGTASRTIGALGGGLILLVWSYLLALAVLTGAQISVLVDAR